MSGYSLILHYALCICIRSRNTRAHPIQNQSLHSLKRGYICQIPLYPGNIAQVATSPSHFHYTTTDVQTWLLAFICPLSGYLTCPCPRTKTISLRLHSLPVGHPNASTLSTLPLRHDSITKHTAHSSHQITCAGLHFTPKDAQRSPITLSSVTPITKTFI